MNAVSYFKPLPIDHDESLIDISLERSAPGSRAEADPQCVRNPSRAHLYGELEGHNAARYCRSEDLRPRRPLLQGLGKGPTRDLQPRLAAERGRLGRPDAFSGCPRIPLHRP